MTEGEKTPAERLFEAARDGDVAALDALLPDATPAQLHEEHDFDFDGRPAGAEATSTPLLVAAWRGNDAVVRRLIAAGADAALGSSEVTPLMAAVAYKHHGCAVALLEAGADVNQEVSFNDNKVRYRALHVVVASACTTEILRLLLIHGADVDAVARDARGESIPLSLAFDTNHEPDTTDADTRKRHFLAKHSLAFTLLRAGADVSHLYEARPHLATDEHPHPSDKTRPLASSVLPTYRHRAYFYTVHIAGGFKAYARARQCQLLTIKLLARGHGRLNLPEAMIPTIVSFWDKPWVPLFSHNGYPT